jgi:hypothetical protein
MGNSAGSSLTTGSGNIILGNAVQAKSPTIDNYLNIGNMIFGDLVDKKIGIGTTSPDSNFTVDVGNVTSSGYTYRNVFRSGTRYTDDIVGSFFAGAVGTVTSDDDAGANISVGIAGFGYSPGTYGLVGIGQNGAIGGLFASTQSSAYALSVANLNASDGNALLVDGKSDFTGDSIFSANIISQQMSSGGTQYVCVDDEGVFFASASACDSLSGMFGSATTTESVNEVLLAIKQLSFWDKLRLLFNF